MSNAITISGSTYTVMGTVKNKATNEGVEDLHVLVYDEDFLRDDFLGIAVTDSSGGFSLSFDASKFRSIVDWRPDLYFIIKDAGLELLTTKSNVIKDANESTPPINFEVDLTNDKLRQLINPTPAAGWVGGFAQSNSAFAYPNPDLTTLVMNKNRENIPKLQRQDISRLGYTDEGQVYSIICPQQGAASPTLGSINVEVTVTGNRGWADESTKEIAADMSVEGRIWFSPSANKQERVKLISSHFASLGLPFPSSKANAIVVTTHNPGDPNQPIFPLRKGSSTDFPIPDFAKHEGLSWSLGHLGVQIGPIVKHESEIVNKFNQLVLDIFNTASGNMLKDGNILTWNVWFTAPEIVDQKEWAEHTELWRESIDADHGSPDGPGTDARFFDGTKFQPLEEILKDELPKVVKFIGDHLSDLIA